MPVDELTTTLPLSGFLLQWRPDSRQWRLIPEHHLVQRDGTPNDLGWERVTGRPDPIGRGVSATATGEAWAEPRWWIVCGEVAASEVVVELPDGTRPEVHILGEVWAAEWVSAPVRATIIRDGEVSTVMHFDRRMHV